MVEHIMLMRKDPHNQEHNFDLNSRVNSDTCTHIQDNKEHQYLM